MSTTRTLKVAAVQPRLLVGEVERNLEHLEDLIREAHRVHQPGLIVVPEGMSSPNVFHPDLAKVPRPIDGAPYQLLTRLSRELGCLIAGGALSVRGRDVYGTFMLAEPDGSAHLHDKDQPTGTECYDYTAGDDDGVVNVAALDDSVVGLASGWEFSRVRTARRIRDAGASLVIGGMCWPYMPDNWIQPFQRFFDAEQALAFQQARDLPAIFARSCGVPVVIASHVGHVTMNMPYISRVKWSTPVLGETQIVDRDGSVLARLSLADGEGIIAAEVSLADPTPSLPLPDGYWIFPASRFVRSMFHATNVLGTATYRVKKRLRRFPWQRWPAADLPDEVPPSELSASAVASELVGDLRPPPAPTKPLPETRYRVDALDDLADGIRQVVLRRPSGLSVPRWTPGAHIDLQLTDDVLRQYSLTGESTDRSVLTLGVLHEPDGRGGSRYVHKELKVGDEVIVRGPRNNFPLVDAASYLLIAGGIGITPLVPMAAHLEAAGADWKLVYGGRTRASMAYADDLVARYGEKVSLLPQDEFGLLPVAELISSCSAGTAVYCCGPAPLLAVVESVVGKSHLDDDALHIERFEAVDDAQFGERVPFTVALSRSATTLQIPAHRSILDVVEDAGIDVVAACRQGVCGTCEVRIVDGTVQHRDSVLSKAERDAGQSMMMCVSRAGADETLTIDL